MTCGWHGSRLCGLLANPNNPQINESYNMSFLIKYHRRESQILLQDTIDARSIGQHEQAAIFFSAAKMHARIMRAVEAGEPLRIGEALYV